MFASEKGSRQATPQTSSQTSQSINNTTSSLNFNTVRQLACHQWRCLLPSLGIDEQYLTRCHGPCPACGGKDRFRFDDKDGRGTFFCNNCRAGDGFRLVELVTGWTPKQTLEAVAQALGLDGRKKPNPDSPHRRVIPAPADRPIEREKRTNKLKQIWLESAPLKPGSPGWKYLTEVRGIPLASIPETARFHNALTYWEPGADGKPRNRGNHPALVFTVHSGNGDPVGLRLIYLTPEGEKLEVKEPKKLQVIEAGAATGGAVRLAEPADLLAISEGIETGLAIQTARAIPVWAAGSAVLLEKIAIPEHVKTVLIFSDNDLNNCGQSAAYALASRLRTQNKAVGIYTPEKPGSDWLDFLYGGKRRV